MLKRLGLEPKIQKLYVMVSIVLLFLAFIFLFLQYNQVQEIHDNQIKTYQRIVGKLAMEYPQEESEIIKCLSNDDNNAEKYGAEILNKYGYNLKDNINDDLSFSRYISLYMIRNILFVGLISGITLLIIFFIVHYIFNYLESISNTLENFIKGNFNYEEEFETEGILSIISSELARLGKSISFNYIKLEDEKENSKALVTDISHQLKTPLASLNMCNSLLEEDGLTNEEKKEFFNMSNQNINKLNSLIDSLVNISRLEAAMIKLKPEDNNIIDTVIKAYNSVYVKAKNKNIEVNLGEMKESIILKHDTKWTEEAIFNVLDNAVKYTPKGGKISLDLEESLNYIKIHIKDNGMGINPKDFNNVFKRFYRCKNAVQSEIEGGGVGLYLTRKILEDQGGSIIVKSKEGKGCLFTLLLPKAFN